MNKTIQIAIDGPAGAGKSTVAKALASDLSLLYLDTGAMYRAMGYYAIKKGADVGDSKQVIPLLDDLKMEIKYISGLQHVFVMGEDVTGYIRDHNISMAASTISKIPEVRKKLVELQREIASKQDCVLDGRDIGSYVLPDATYKFFVTASPEERAKRRHLELTEKGVKIDYKDVLKDIVDRDHQDTTRAFAPLIKTEDAYFIDTTNLSIEDVISSIKLIIKK